MITYLVNNLICVGFNLINSRVDAYKIKVLNKEIRHGINLVAYGCLVGFLIYKQQPTGWPEIWQQVLFGLSAFFNRQLSFDIPLNLRRQIAWYYQSTAVKPKAFWDRVERWMFGSLSGKWIAGIYAGCWVICTTILVFL